MDSCCDNRRAFRYGVKRDIGYLVGYVEVGCSQGIRPQEEVDDKFHVLEER